jgi:adenine-specific DNA-methyltransferase
MTEHLEPERLDLTSLDIAAEKQAELLRLFPEVRTEGGKVDFDRLRMALGESVDVGKERYGMNWPGKADCFRAIQRPSLGTLLPVREESVNFDETENLIIEGDNLEVLKLLQKSYQGKVKMIYIDPPYNTGNDFIYPDNYSESLQTYLEYTGQVDNEGRKFSNNVESDGRFHSKWLSMMYPRLYLAQNLLSEDGVIFISIDDAELQNLRRICDDIFGEDNFLSLLIWKKKYIGGKHAKHFVDFHEYLAVYARDAERTDSFVMKRPEAEMEKFDLSDHHESIRGKYYIRPLKSNLGLRETLIYAITCPDGSTVTNQWMVAPSTYFDLLADERIVFKKSRDGNFQVYRKFYERDGEGKVMVPSLIDDVANANGKIELKDLFQVKEGRDIPFDNPKPTGLIAHLITPSTGTDDIVLDFFAGSGTTAHAVLALNRADNGNRRFILVQLPEPTDQEGFKTIADITKERVRRVIQEHESKTEGKLDLGGGRSEGFRVLKLATSNFNVWNATTEATTPEALGQQLELHVDHIQKGRASEDLLYEILLKSGFPLTTPIEALTIEGKTVYSVTGYGMLICIDKQLTHEMIKAIAERKPSHVVCLDEGFAGNDQLKTNAVLIMKSKGVTKFQTI